MAFEFLDPCEPLTITRRNLPHWEQAGKTYFITFRTADSMTDPVVAAWRYERDGWLRAHGLDPADAEWHAGVEALPSAVRAEFHATFSARFHEYLDAGHGECLLRRPALAKIVAQSLRHFDGDRYHMGDFVVMPNHVHLLVQFVGADMLKRQCRSWKKFTAGEINRVLGRRGHFWQGESYDRLIREPEEFWHYREYVAANPAKAGLRAGEYLYYRCPDA